MLFVSGLVTNPGEGKLSIQTNCIQYNNFVMSSS